MSTQPIEAPEEWRPVIGYEGAYDVSDLGRVRSWMPHGGSNHPRPLMSHPRILKATAGSGGYLTVSLSMYGERRTGPVHTLVTRAFLGPRPDGLVIRHLDGDQANNAVENLAYGTYSENERDKVRHGTHNNARKTHCPRDHEYGSPEQRGKRRCIPCAIESRRLRTERERMERAEGIAQQLAAQEITNDEALDALRRGRLKSDGDALAQVVEAIHDRDGLAGGLIDPLHYLEATPRPGLNALQMAVELAEDALESNIRALAMQP